jgi:hypothetical protein
MGVLADGGTLGAVRTKVERAVPAGFLADPDAVADFCNDGAADGTMRADRLDGLDRAVDGGLRAGLRDRAAGGADRGKTTDGKALSAQERASVDRFVGDFRNQAGPRSAPCQPSGFLS